MYICQRKIFTRGQQSAKEASDQQKLYTISNHLAMESLKIFCFVSLAQTVRGSRAFFYNVVDIDKIVAILLEKLPPHMNAHPAVQHYSFKTTILFQLKF